MSQPIKLLIVDDDQNLRKTLSDILRVKGYDSMVVGSGDEAIAAAEQEPISLALIDLKLPDMSGLDVMERIKAISPLTEAIILTGYASLDTAIEATKRGAFSYLIKPYQMDDLLLVIRHAIERQLAQQEIRRLSEALRQSHEAIVLLDSQFHFEYVNTAFTLLFGYPIAELTGESISLIGVTDDIGFNMLRVADIAALPGGFAGETMCLTKDGHLIPILINIAPIHDQQGRIINLVATFTDLTVLRQMEESLLESEEKFRSISSAAHDSIIMLDENGAINFWNTAAETTFGYLADEVLGKDMHTMFAPERFHQAYSAGFANFQATGQGYAIGKTLELAAIRKGGEEFPIEISLSTVQRRNQWHAIGIVRDISERKRAEQEAQTYVTELTRTNSELKTLNAKLEQAQSQLIQSEKMASIGILAAGIAHEINNPIGFIKSNIGSLEKYVQDFLLVLNAYQNAEFRLQEHKEFFPEVHELKERTLFEYEKQDVLELLAETVGGLERITKIVTDLKGFARLESTVKWMMDDIHKGIESTLNVIWNELIYTCVVKKEYGPLPPVECVLPQLNQVFMNLLVNAAQAIESKGTITIRTGVAEDRIWIEISDTGKGIPPENIKAIFVPFFTTKPVGKGTGLGLSVSYDIIRKHHGRIDIESAVGKGSTFRIWLPINQGHNNDSFIVVNGQLN
ncbi:MAG: PAS domain S-box protein [Methylobacter sp.]|nr:PAS domain S-box protein [Methylobacter sp.]